MIILTESDFNYLYILIPIVVLVLVILAFILIRKVQKHKYLQKRKDANNDMILALGGNENIVSAVNKGSRLSLVLNDYSIIDEARLKELGVSSIIKMSNKITLVIGAEAQDILNLINKN